MGTGIRDTLPPTTWAGHKNTEDPGLKSPGMVAAILAASMAPSMTPSGGHHARLIRQPSRVQVGEKREMFERGMSKRDMFERGMSKRDMFERGMSEPLLNLKIKAPLERGMSYDSLKRRENEAQRLVKYRSASSVASFDSGLSLSRGGSRNGSRYGSSEGLLSSRSGSTEDLRRNSGQHDPLVRSVSSDRMSRKRSHETSPQQRRLLFGQSRSSSYNLSRLSFNGEVVTRRDSREEHLTRRDSREEHLHRQELVSPGSDWSNSTPDFVLPDLLCSTAPPLPPKKNRPPLPPRRISSSSQPEPAPPLPPRQYRQGTWDNYSDDGSGGETSDASLPEYLVDVEDTLECETDIPWESSGGSVKGTIPESFPFKDPLQKFLADLGQALSTEVVIKNVYGAGPGQLDLHCHTSHESNTPDITEYSLPQAVSVPRPSSLSPALRPSAISPALNRHAGDKAISKKYRTELQIFFRTGSISRLEEQRDLVLTDTVTRFQAHCRGHLARKRLHKRRVQETAIRCIQKNVRKFMGVRDWPWWRLLVRVTPLLNVHRTEEELRSTKDELESLRSKLEKSETERNTLKVDNNKLEARLSEITADLTEEHSTATLAGERLEAEQSERMKLEKEVGHLQDDVRRIEQERNNIELESLHRRTDMLLNSEVNGDLDDDHMDFSLYKRKYEWCLKEIEVLKKQLKTQQEDDFDQLVLLKKQLEKKVGDANEEADEQRQVVGQMKKKTQRLTAEMNDLKILLEEQSSRNNLLEKKQRKFDQDVNIIQEELRHEKLNKDKIQREKDSILSEKYSFEQEVSTLKLELELKEEKVSALNRELDDLTSSGKVEEEVSTLKRAKHELELRIKDQEEELDDLAGQVQMLEGAKVRLEMSIEQMRKENRKEIQQREEELDEVRMGAHKKIKALELQIENEHEERTLLVRERHELERRIADLQERTITSVDEDYVHKIKKELKKTKVLLKDTQTMLDKAQSEGSSKLLVRQLKTQLEDAEFAKTAAIKARQSAEADLNELQVGLDEAQRLRKDAEERTTRLAKDKTELQTQLDESEEEVAEVMKKYKATVSQLSVDQITLSEQSQLIAELEHEKQMMHDRLTEMTSKVEVLEGETANIHTQRRLEMKIKEMESKLELELTTRQRLESQIGRLKDQLERLGGECESAKVKESQSIDHSKKLGRQLREAKEDLSTLQQRHTDVSNKKQEIEKQMELQDSEILTLKSDLKLAFKRIEEFQQALQGDLSDSDSDISDSDSDSDGGSLSSYLTASLRQQTRSSSNSTLRTPPSELHQERGEPAHSPTSEGAMSMISEDEEFNTKESFA